VSRWPKRPSRSSRTPTRSRQPQTRSQRPRTSSRKRILGSSIDAIIVKRAHTRVPIEDRVTILWRGEGPDDRGRALHAAGLVHRRDEFVFAARPAVRLTSSSANSEAPQRKQTKQK
jgi:hypothetical protein